VKRRLLTAFSIITVTGVSLSKVFLMVHYPWDEAGGVLIGFACGFSSVKGFGFKNVKPWLQPLALTILISIVNIANGWEVSASQALLGLAFSLTLASSIIDRPMWILDSLSLPERLAMGLGGFNGRVSSVRLLGINIVRGLSRLLPSRVAHGFYSRIIRAFQKDIVNSILLVQKATSPRSIAFKVFPRESSRTCLSPEFLHVLKRLDE